MARQAVADKRQRRERGSISVDEIINGAFDVAARSVGRRIEHAAAGQASRCRRDEHLLVLPEKGRSAQRDDRPRAGSVRLRDTLCRRPGLAGFVARSRPKDAPDVSRQPDPVRSDPDPRHLRPRGDARGVREAGEGGRHVGRGRPVARGRVRHLRQHLRAHPGRGSPGTAAGQIRRSRTVSPRWELGDRPRDHAADRQADRERSPHRRRRRHQLRVRPELAFSITPAG